MPAEMLEVFRVTPLPNNGGPVTAWVGPTATAQSAVRVAAEVLRLPPSMRCEVEQEDSAGRWHPVCTMAVRDA